MEKKTANKYTINDQGMYHYFEGMIYNFSEEKLPPEWKLGNHEEEYGLTENNVDMLLGSRRLLYSQEDAENQLCLLETLEKFVHEYIGIPGMDELLINNYAAIENGIFLEHDENGNPKNIREHAKHQIKNAYLGSVLLLQCDYLEDVAKTIDREQSPITQYLKREAKRSIYERSGRQIEATDDEIIAKLKEFSYKIFMMASLLHDIGYPLEYYLRLAGQMTNYPPYLKILSATAKADFAELKSYLTESKLFRMIDNRKIEKKYSKNDHGVLSAVSLLMHFYHNGKIYSLSKDQQCLVEMAAIAIYKHTDRFDENTRMVYLTDPVSYMVRLCDDMQEWERFKILINRKHNYLQCDACRKLMVENDGIYSCPDCEKKYRKLTKIDNQKINYVYLCDKLVIERNEQRTKINFSFNLLKQLEIILDDYVAVKKCEKNVRDVINMLKDQSLQPSIEIDYFVSNNPVMIVNRIIGGQEGLDKLKVLCADNGDKTNEQIIKFLKVFDKLDESDYGKKVETDELRYWEKAKQFVIDYYGEICDMYEKLHCEEEA